ncbi:MAG: chemotaxis protein CheW [Myxococcaceae bacterium]
MSPAETGPSDAASDVLLRRAERLRRKPTEDDAGDDSEHWFAEFPVGDTRYAIPLEQLRAVVPLARVTMVPLTPPQVLGVLRFQGEIIAALSVGSLLDAQGWRRDPQVLLVVETGRGHRVALDCEEIPKPIAVPTKLLEQARSGTSNAGTETVTIGRRKVSILSIGALVARVSQVARDS